MRTKKSLLGMLLVALVMTFSLAFIFGCKGKMPPAEKTLKIGFVGWLGGPAGLDSLHDQELLAELDNKKGGIKIGDERYNVQGLA